MWYAADDDLSHYTGMYISQSLEYPSLPVADRLHGLRVLLHGSIPQTQIGPAERSVLALILLLLWLSSVQPVVSVATILLLAAGPAVLWRHLRRSGHSCWFAALIVNAFVNTEVYFAALFFFASLPPLILTDPQDAKLLAARPEASVESTNAMAQICLLYTSPSPRD